MITSKDDDAWIRTKARCGIQLDWIAANTSWLVRSVVEVEGYGTRLAPEYAEQEGIPDAIEAAIESIFKFTKEYFAGNVQD